MRAYASYWTGSLDDCLALLERAHGVFLRAGDRQQAALAALNLQWDYMSKPAKSLATGWYRRAERMLESCPECAAHGYLAQRESGPRCGDAPGGLELLDEAVVAAISGELGTMTTAAVYCPLSPAAATWPTMSERANGAPPSNAGASEKRAPASPAGVVSIAPS